jgi:hypothetical protein
MARRSGDGLYRTRAAAAKIGRIVERIGSDGKTGPAMVKAIGHPKRYVMRPRIVAALMGVRNGGQAKVRRQTPHAAQALSRTRQSRRSSPA